MLYMPSADGNMRPHLASASYERGRVSRKARVDINQHIYNLRFRRAAYTAIDLICDYQESLEQLPVVAQVEPGYLGKLLPS